MSGMRFSNKLSTGILIMFLLAGCGRTIPETTVTATRVLLHIRD